MPALVECALRVCKCRKVQHTVSVCLRLTPHTSPQDGILQNTAGPRPRLETASKTGRKAPATSREKARIRLPPHHRSGSEATSAKRCRTDKPVQSTYAPGSHICAESPICRLECASRAHCRMQLPESRMRGTIMSKLKQAWRWRTRSTRHRGKKSKTETKCEGQGLGRALAAAQNHAPPTQHNAPCQMNSCNSILGR